MKEGEEPGEARFHVPPRDEASQRVIEALQALYRKKLRPVEEAFSFGRFHHDAITDTELEAKSQVLVIGQYSTGKTTFIRHLLGTDFPNMNIGPEPTSDKFTVVIHGEEDRPVEGNSLAVIKELPYEGLTRFGTGLLNKLDAAISTSPFLENITLVDTPGVLSGEMQMHQRAYNFADVARWFADRSDMILLLFDAHRLDVSDELMEILMRLKDHQKMIRVVLNKADQVDKAKLRKVYGALMWSMGKVFDTPEVIRVYIGSFWEKPLKHTAHQGLFKADEESLTRELTDLPRLSAIRKIDQIIKRTKLVRAHAFVLSYMSDQTPWIFFRASRREYLLKNMEGVLETVRAKHGLHQADMPDADALRINLEAFDFASFPTLSRVALRQLNDVVDVDIHKVLKEAGGSKSIFKFSTNRAPPPPPGLLKRAGSSLLQLFAGNKGTAPTASTAAATTAAATAKTPSAPTTAMPVASSADKGARPLLGSEIISSGRVSAAPSAQSEAGSGERSSRRGVLGSSATEEGMRKKRQGERDGASLCSLVQILRLLLVLLVVFLLALGPMLLSRGGPFQTATTGFADQAKRLLWQVRADSAPARRPAEDDGDGGESLETVPEEVEALYRGTVY